MSIFLRIGAIVFYQIPKWIWKPQTIHNHRETRHNFNPWPSLVLLFCCFSKGARQSYNPVVSSWTKCCFILVWRGSCLLWLLRNIIAQQTQSFLFSAELRHSESHSLCGGLYTEAPRVKDGRLHSRCTQSPWSCPLLEYGWADPSAFLQEFERIRMKAKA